MPKHAVHVYVLNSVIDRLCESNVQQEREIGEVMRRNHFEAVLGSFGPDLHVWAPRRDDSSALIRFLHNMKLAVDQYGHVASIINDSMRNGDVVVEGMDTSASRKELAGKVDECIRNMVSSISPGIFSGIADGYDFFADPAGLQSLINSFLEGTTNDRASGRGLAEYDWSDRLHFWHAGEYVRNLLLASTDEAGKAYAYGFMTHIATDLIGHQMVRKAIGGSYNKNPQGHFVCESFLDAWSFYGRSGLPLNGNMVCDLGLETEMPGPITRAIRNAMALTYGHEEGIGDSYPSEDELNETYARIRYHYVLQDGLYLRKPMAPFPDVEKVLDNVMMKYDDGCDQTMDLISRPGQIGADGGKSYDYKAELEFRLFNIGKNVKRASDEIDTMLEILPIAEDDREARSLEYGIWSRAYDIISGLLSTIALTGFIVPEPADLSHEYARKLLYVNAGAAGVQNPDYYINGRKFDARKIKGYIDSHTGDGPIIAGDDDELGNAVDMAAWMISGSGNPGMEKYVFANWAMESEEL